MPLVALRVLHNFHHVQRYSPRFCGYGKAWMSACWDHGKNHYR